MFSSVINPIALVLQSIKFYKSSSLVFVTAAKVSILRLTLLIKCIKQGFCLVNSAIFKANDQFLYYRDVLEIDRWPYSLVIVNV